MPSKAIKKSDAKVTKKTTTKKAVAKKDGVTVNCFDKQTVVPKDEQLADNVGRFARKMGMGSYSVFSSSRSGASAMSEFEIQNYQGTELWITERNKAS